MFFRQNRTWHLLRQNLIKLKQNTAIVAECVPCVCRVWNGTVLKRYGLVSAQHHQRAGFSLIYTQALTNDRCAQWCLKHFYEAVGVIKNVYYDGAEWLAGRMLLITSYCFKWIRWAELLKSKFSRRFNPLKVISWKWKAEYGESYVLPHVICWHIEFSLMWNKAKRVVLLQL